MRKIKKINGFLVVRFNDREKRNYPDLGSFGVIDAEQYTGDIDFDRDAMEYTDADCIEVAVEQARGLESESDFSEEPPVCTVIVESDAECSEEEVEPQLMIAGWEQQLETQVESKHYPDIDAKAAAHELHGFKVALYRLGMIGKSETEVDPDHFEPNKLEEPEPTSPTETEPDTFIHANKGIRSEWTVRKVYGLGLMLAQDCPPNDCKTEIMGEAQATAQQMALFCRSKNAEPKLTSCTLEQLAEIFLEEGKAEGVRGDVAFAQSLHETGYFKFGGIVLPSQNNYAGIGALNGNATGQAATFPDPRTGVRAQIQHLKAYASTEPLVNACVDPRFSLVTRGSAPYVEWLGAADNPNGKGWAVPGIGYGANVVKLLGQIMAQEAPESPSPAPEPDPLANYPDWQRNGLTALVKAGVINSPDYWANKFGEAIKVGEIIGILGKMMEQPTE